MYMYLALFAWQQEVKILIQHIVLVSMLLQCMLVYPYLSVSTPDCKKRSVIYIMFTNTLKPLLYNTTFIIPYQCAYIVPPCCEMHC